MEVYREVGAPLKITTRPGVVVLGLEVGVFDISIALNEEARMDHFIAQLKEAKAAAWPKPLKTLCPSSKELLNYLRRYDGITPLKAREELGIEHLPRRIKDLKEHGFNIVTTFKRGYGGKRYGHYKLTEEIT